MILSSALLFPCQITHTVSPDSLFIGYCTSITNQKSCWIFKALSWSLSYAFSAITDLNELFLLSVHAHIPCPRSFLLNALWVGSLHHWHDFQETQCNYYFNTDSQLTLSSFSLNYNSESGTASKSGYLSSKQDIRTISCVVPDSFFNLLLSNSMWKLYAIKDLYNRVFLESKLVKWFLVQHRTHVE